MSVDTGDVRSHGTTRPLHEGPRPLVWLTVAIPRDGYEDATEP